MCCRMHRCCLARASSTAWMAAVRRAQRAKVRYFIMQSGRHAASCGVYASVLTNRWSAKAVVCAADAAAARTCQRAGGQALFGTSSRTGGWAAEGRSDGLDIPKPCARVLAMERDGSDGSYASAFSLDMFSPGDPLLGAAGQGLLATSCEDHGLLSADCGALLLRCLRERWEHI